MAQFVADIPDDQVARVIDALCQVGGYSGDPTDDKARAAFAKRTVAHYIRDTVLRVEGAAAFAVAAAAIPQVDPITVT